MKTILPLLLLAVLNAATAQGAGLTALKGVKLNLGPDLPTGGSRIYLDIENDTSHAVNTNASDFYGAKIMMWGGGATVQNRNLYGAWIQTTATGSSLGGSGNTASGATTLVIINDTLQGTFQRLRAGWFKVQLDGHANEAIGIHNEMVGVGNSSIYDNPICLLNDIHGLTGQRINNPTLIKGMIRKETSVLAGVVTGINLSGWTTGAGDAITSSYGVYLGSDIGVGPVGGKFAIYSAAAIPSFFNGQMQLGSGAPLSFAATTFSGAFPSPPEGSLQAFTDSTTATWGATITGGGSNHVLGYYNGSNWTVFGK